MDPVHEYFFNINRRQMLKGVAAGGIGMFGGTALSQLFAAVPRPQFLLRHRILHRRPNA